MRKWGAGVTYTPFFVVFMYWQSELAPEISAISIGITELGAMRLMR